MDTVNNGMMNQRYRLFLQAGCFAWMNPEIPVRQRPFHQPGSVLLVAFPQSIGMDCNIIVCKTEFPAFL